jgi:hypothetical protein
MKKFKVFILMVIVSGFYSCQNDDWSFEDNPFSTVYFSYQYPVRTLTMGEDIFDTSLDNEHKCAIYATWGGGYSNKNDVVVDFVVDPTLCDNLYYKETDGSTEQKVEVMPSNYYTLTSNQITIPKGSVSGGVEVHLEDAFFNDPMALKRNYVIPLVMTNVTKADSILVGKTSKVNANRNVTADWEILPKDYILYAVKYINTWDGFYLRRGTDLITDNNSTPQTVVRQEQYVEYDQVVEINTASLTKAEFPLSLKDINAINVDVTLVLSFDSDGNCTITSGTVGITASGTGKFVKKGELQSWGAKDRDALYLDYSVDLGTRQYTTKDTLVARNRGVAKEVFNVVVK